ncbi:phage tail-collar fiber domain-containing protein [Vibrio parahaemolyticus]|uniref:phage tail-collar fiber domain-containing protein n=1 Tax=Vibrio parahaemolyticus TaxID=670 RepID=UPI001D16CAFA|nr:phage tail protein [Vibrio parahaemolyticus]MCC3798265.1 phage tail protein [Vibrio parahaemolyticus]
MTQTPENQQQYGSILTILGENAEQNGKLQNKQITFTHIAIGDANDTYVQPDRAQNALVNELARIPVNSVDVLQPTPDSVPMLKVEAILPDNVNDLVIREFAAVAEFNEQSYFHAIGNCARIYVPPPVNNGNVLTPVTLEMIFVITSAEPIIEIDPNVVTASREWVDKRIPSKEFQIFVEGALRSSEDRFKDRPDIREYQSLVSDGLWNDAIDTALRENTAVLMPNKTFDVSDTVRLKGRGFGLQGYSKNARNYSDSTFKLRWRGGNEPRKAVVLFGQNEVGAEPLIDATDNVLSNVFIDCGNDQDGRAGFGVYGTYLTNETLLDRISVVGSSEYNFYLARSWYASYKNLFSFACKNNGIAMGMPLRYSNGELVEWSAPAPLEMNNTEIYNLRSHSAGQKFSVDAPGTFNPMDLNMVRQGYGVGLGIGNSFHAKKVTSEGSGGFNLYSFTSAQPQKTIKELYLESTMKNSGLDPATELGNILFEADNATGGSIEVTDVFSNYHGGGIYLLGEKRPMRLKNVHQPRFLKSIDGLSKFEIDSFVYRENCYHGLGYHTTEDRTVIADEVHNIRYSWEIDIPFDPTVLTGGGQGHPMYYVAIKANGEDPGPSTFVVEYEDGTTASYNYPNPLPEEWTHFARLEGRVVKIRRGGNVSDTNVNVRFNIVKMNPSYV